MGTSVASRGLLDLKREGNVWPMFVKKYAYSVHIPTYMIVFYLALYTSLSKGINCACV